MNANPCFPGPETILSLFQEAAHACLDQMGVDRKKLYEKKNLLVILESTYTLDHPSAEISASASLDGFNPFLMTFAFSLADSLDTVVGSGRAVWALMDAQSRRILPTSALGIPVTGCPMLQTMHLLQDLTEETIVYADRSLLDHNGHVNNARYTRWFPDEGNRITSLKIQYRKEILPDQEVLIRWGRKQNIIECCGSVNGSICFESRYSVF